MEAPGEEQEDSGAGRDGSRAEEPGLALIILARPENSPQVPRLVGRETAPEWLTHGPPVSSAKAFNVEMKAGLPLNN